MKSKIYRGWINQPSTLQPAHKYHGKSGIVVDDGEADVLRIFFTEGETYSMDILRLNVSKGT